MRHLLSGSLLLTVLGLGLIFNSTAAVHSSTDNQSRRIDKVGPEKNATINGPAPSCTAAPPGMIAWWDAEGSARDIRGENNGTLNGNATAAAIGEVGKAFSLDGASTTVVSVPDKPSLNVQQFSIDAWVFPTVVDGANDIIVNKEDSSSVVKQYEISVRGPANPGGTIPLGNLAFFIGGISGLPSDQSGWVDGAGAVPLNTWTHIALTFDGSSAVTYINGALKRTVNGLSGSVAVTSGPLRIGSRDPSAFAGDAQAPFNGLLDEVELFNRALTATEVNNIFNAGSAGKCKPRCANAPSGLVSWWDADDDPFDRQGTNHGAMPPAGASFGTGKVGRAFTFDGSQNPVAVPDNASLDLQTLTIDAWVFPTTLDGAEDIVINKEVPGTVQYEIGVKGSISTGGSIPFGNLTVFVGGISGLPNEDTGWVNGGGPLPLNTWSHIAMTFDGSTLSAYINGVLTRQVTGLSGTVPSSSGPFRIGARNPNVAFATDPFNGSIDEVEFFNRALLPAEIKAINNAGSAGKCKKCLDPTTLGNMVGFWGGDGSAFDASGFGNQGALAPTPRTPGFIVGKVGQAFNFTADRQYVSIPDAPSMRPQSLTIDGWANLTGAPNAVQSYFGKPIGTINSDSYAVWYQNGTLHGAICADGNGNCAVVDAPSFSLNTWHHVAFTFDDPGGATTKTLRLYVDGVQVASGTTSLAIGYDNQAALIGADFDFIYGDNGIGYSWQGGIDEVELFNRALTQTEIQSLVAAGASGKCKTQNTPVGAGVNNQGGDASSILFGNVSNSGQTTYQNLDTYQAGPMPYGYNPPVHIGDISTTATFTGGVKTCFNLQAVTDPNLFLQLRILHLEGNLLIDRTSLSVPSSRTLCANTTSLSPFVISQNVNASPTAAPGAVVGRITTSNGIPVEGAVINLSGDQTRKTITDANGNYHFNNVGVNGFYTVTPSRVNYNFTPFNRSFNLLGNHADAAFGAISTGDNANPLDTPEYFVRQQYVDLLGREPDEGGFNYWSDQINQCNGDPDCIRSKRVDVAAAFFVEAEFQQTGSFIYDLYSGALGRRPMFNEYSTDRKQVLGGPNLDAEKAAFAQSFVQRAEFTTKYQGAMTAGSFVDALIQNVQQVSGVDLSSQRDALIARYNNGADLNQSRSFVLSDVAANSAFNQAQYNRAFVLTEYFGYLQRKPDQGGYDFWLNVINDREVGNYRGMVCAFITSTEYQQRFSSVVSLGNGECGP